MEGVSIWGTIHLCHVKLNKLQLCFVIHLCAVEIIFSFLSHFLSKQYIITLQDSITWAKAYSCVFLNAPENIKKTKNKSEVRLLKAIPFNNP